MNIPYLAGVIEAKDVKEKGTTGFRAKYMAWAKVAQLFNEHCKGWTFHLRPSKEGSLIWHAPTGAFLCLYFKDPEGKEYSDFPYAIMDNRNNAIPIDRITARDVADSSRRGFVAACCNQFSLGFQLWAQEEIESNEPAVDNNRWRKTPTPQPDTVAQPLAKADREFSLDMIQNLYEHDQPKFKSFDSDFRNKFKLNKNDKLSDFIQEPKHRDFIAAYIG